MTPLPQSMRTATRTLELLLQWAVIAALAALVFDVLWGVFTRFVLGSPSRWTEEVAQYLLMWVALLGAGVAHGRREHLGFDLLTSRLDPGAQRLLALAAEGIVTTFAALVMVYGGYVLVTETLTSNQLTPALELKMGYVYLALPVSGVFIVMFSVQRLFEIICGEDVRRPDEQRVSANPPSST